MNHQNRWHAQAPAPGQQLPPTYGSPYDHDVEPAHHASEHNRMAIPGLGVDPGHPSGVPAWPHVASGPAQNMAVYASHGHVDSGSSSVYVPSRHGALAQDVWTEAEAQLSDGELEDLYEPTLEGEVTSPVPLPLALTIEQHAASLLQDPAAAQAIERPASYSPQLSSGLDDQSKATANLDAPKGMEVEQARTRAREAISHLWPLEVRFENYLDNGIDKTLLQGLFSELGLSFQAPEDRHHAGSDGHASKDPVRIPQPAPPSSTDDKAESRKDRIARLLAAKGSRQQTAPAAPPPATLSTPRAQQKPSGKSLEKSKLLYEKMEALRKAREAKAHTSRDQPQQADSVPENHVPANNEEANKTSHEIFRDGSDLSPDHSTQVVEDAQPPQPAPRPAPYKRPVASDFLSQQQEPALKRPFSQTDRLGPFQIDVSEDEDSDDDTAMELDSPEQRPAILRRNATGDSALRDHPPLSNLPSNGRSTPQSGIGRSTSAMDKQGLSKMQQDIEDMKKRIAEAEARKKARQSRQGTPHQSPSLTASGAATAPSPTPLPSPSVPNTADTPMRDPAPASTPPSGAAAGGNTNRSTPALRPSLSRATLDRLAVIEADRKRQTLKMKILKAQLSQMEREMAANIEEEKTLREETRFDAEHEQTATSALEPEHVDSPVTQLPCEEAENPGAPVQSSTESSGIPNQSSPKTLSGHAMGIVEPARRKPEVQPVAMTNSASDHGSQHSVEMEDVSPKENPLAIPTLTESPSAKAASKASSPLAPAPAGGGFSATITAAQELLVAGSSPESVEMGSSDSASADDDDSSARTNDSDSDSAQSHSSEFSGSRRPGSESASDAGLAGIEPVRQQQDEDPVPLTGTTTASNRQANDADKADGSGHTYGDTNAQDIRIPQDPNIVQEPDAKASFQPYESPLQYFHAYRFHPEFSKSVKGGLRSLTYSNKLDVRQQLCPEELLGQECPRGDQCDFQHLGTVAAPDDQILMQLGSYGAHEGDQQEEFNKGLRKLLTEFRDQKVKDFQTISQAIIDYRAQFHHDKSKILPLGNVSL